MAVQTQIQARRGTAATWTSTNPTLAAGETGYETDTGKFKIGTGSTAWASLGYFNQDPVTTKGDLYTFSTTDARLAVGANGETIVADSSTSTGLRWQGSAIGKNAVINGACEIAQRGTAAVTLSNATFGYPVDRFFVGRSAGSSGATAQQITSTTLDGFQYAVRVQRTAADTSTAELQIGQNFESSNSIPFANKTVVVSFYARAGANYSPTSSVLGVRFYTGTGSNQSGYGFNFTGTAAPISTNATLTTSWQRFQYTATLSSTTTQVQFFAFATPTGTAGAADYYDITGLQVELGSVATPFSRSSGTIQGELAACQRYYWRISGATAPNVGLSTVAFNGSTTPGVRRSNVPLPTTMRVKPTVSIAGTHAVYTSSLSNLVLSSLGFASSSTSFISTDLNLGSAGTNGQAGWWIIDSSSANDYLEASAEL